MIPHGNQKPVKSDDPYELVAQPISGVDMTFMAECLVEEFAAIGWSKEAIEQMFYNPFYQAAHNFFRAYGKERVKELVADVVGRNGGIQVRMTESSEEPNKEDHNHE